jgi:hypothetical protein
MDEIDIQIKEYDPTGKVNLRDPAEVGSAIKDILDLRYGRQYDAGLLQHAIADLTAAYSGNYPDLMRCDTQYHDLRHALETGLTMARMIDGDFHLAAAEGYAPIVADQALLGIVLALFHDVGLLRHGKEAGLQGAELLPVHEERGVEFLISYLSITSLTAIAGKAELIMPTKLIFKIPPHWPQPDKKLASMVATADLLSQMADRCYLEKCRDFLYLEFMAIGLAGKPDSPYPSPAALLQKTPSFYFGFVRDRLDHEFAGVHRLIDAHFGGINPYQMAILRHLDYLSQLLATENFSALHRQPSAFVGESSVH